MRHSGSDRVARPAPEPLRLDDLGRRFGTELSSLGRDCLRGWERYIPPRTMSFDLLEIGAGGGASLRTWRDWFPRARLVGLDVRRIAPDPAIERCEIVHGAQTDPEVMRRLVRTYRFRMIVDDGSPYPEEKIQTFLAFFPWLEPGSVYFCCTGFDGTDGVAAAIGHVRAGVPSEVASVPEWFARMAATLAGDPAPSTPENDLTMFGETLDQTREVAFLRGSVVVVR